MLKSNNKKKQSRQQQLQVLSFALKKIRKQDENQITIWIDNITISLTHFRDLLGYKQLTPIINEFQSRNYSVIIKSFEFPLSPILLVYITT